MESPLQERVLLVCSAGMARTFEFVLHFVRCVMVTVTPNRSIIIIIQLKYHCMYTLVSELSKLLNPNQKRLCEDLMFHLWETQFFLNILLLLLFFFF